MKLSDYVIKYLEDYGIKNIYSVAGGMIMHITESIGNSNINLINFMHEQGACVAAEADSIYNNKLSVIATTAGPGILNIVNPIASAYIDGNAMLIIGGQCKTEDMKKNSKLRQKGIQEVDAVNILSNITKYSVSIKDSKDIKYELDRAIYIATHGKHGPCFLEIPLDIQNENINEDTLPTFSKKNTSMGLNLDNFNYLFDLLNSSQRPVILAGNGIRKSNSLSLFKELVSILKIPILLTWKSMDFLENNHPLYFGRPGSISLRNANFIIQTCDLILCIGTRLDLPTVAFNYSNFAKNAKKIIVDIDEAEIKKLNFDLEFNMDAKYFLNTLKQNLDKIDVNVSLWINKCNDLKKRYNHIKKIPIIKNYINAYNFINCLSTIADKNDIIVPSSSGSASEMICQSFKIKKGQRVICSNGLGSMGYAISHSIGAFFASSNKQILCIEGDGSIQMNLSELELIKRYNIPIKIFVLNNNGYASIRNTQSKFFNGHLVACDKESGVTLPDLKRIANAYKIKYYKIETEKKLMVSLKNILKEKNPIICEVIIDPSFQTQPKVMSKTDENGKIVSGTMEDMWPYIDRDKFDKIMRNNI